MASLTDKQIAAALHKHNGLIAVAARALGCDRKTIYNRVWASADLAAELQEARDNMDDEVESLLYQNIRERDQRAIEFYLKNKKRDYSDKLHIGGMDGGPVAFEVIHVIPGEPDGDA